MKYNIKQCVYENPTACNKKPILMYTQQVQRTDSRGVTSERIANNASWIIGYLNKHVKLRECDQK